MIETRKSFYHNLSHLCLDLGQFSILGFLQTLTLEQHLRRIWSSCFDLYLVGRRNFVHLFPIGPLITLNDATFVSFLCWGGQVKKEEILRVDLSLIGVPKHNINWSVSCKQEWTWLKRNYLSVDPQHDGVQKVSVKEFENRKIDFHRGNSVTLCPSISNWLQYHMGEKVHWFYFSLFLPSHPTISCLCIFNVLYAVPRY